MKENGWASKSLNSPVSYNGFQFKEKPCQKGGNVCPEQNVLLFFTGERDIFPKIVQRMVLT